jgi:hypothetical protein
LHHWGRSPCDLARTGEPYDPQAGWRRFAGTRRSSINIKFNQALYCNTSSKTSEPIAQYGAVAQARLTSLLQCAAPQHKPGDKLFDIPGDKFSC